MTQRFVEMDRALEVNLVVDGQYIGILTVGPDGDALIAAALDGWRPIVGWNPDGTAKRRGHVVSDTSGWVSAARLGWDVEVTPEMVAAVEQVIQNGAYVWDSAVEMRANCGEDVCRAVLSLAPVPLVPDGELAAVRERDALQAAYDGLGKTIGNLMVERDEALKRLQTFATANREQSVSIDALMDDNAQLSRIRWELTAELARAHDLLRKIGGGTAGVVADTPPKPAPVIREHRSEPWRMGR